jgi:hypothetical protein
MLRSIAFCLVVWTKKAAATAAAMIGGDLVLSTPVADIIVQLVKPLSHHLLGSAKRTRRRSGSGS